MSQLVVNFVWSIQHLPKYLGDRLRELGVEPTPELVAAIRQTLTTVDPSMYDRRAAAPADPTGTLIARVYDLYLERHREWKALVAAVPRDRIYRALTLEGCTPITSAFAIGHALYTVRAVSGLARLSLRDNRLDAACRQYLIDHGAYYETEEDAVRAGRLPPRPPGEIE
jgi:hypothetical protein